MSAPPSSRRDNTLLNRAETMAVDAQPETRALFHGRQQRSTKLALGARKSRTDCEDCYTLVYSGLLVV